MIFKRKQISFSRNSINLFKKINFLFGLFFLVQLFIILIIFFVYNFTSIKTKLPPERISLIISKNLKSLTGFDFTNVDDYILVTLKGVFFKIAGNKIDNINLSISQKNLFTIEMQRKHRFDVNSEKDLTQKELVNQMVKGKLNFKDKSLRIKMRVKGDRKIHFDEKKNTSLKIDLIGEDRLFGLEEFSLQKPIVRNYIYEYIFHELLKESGNISLKYIPVNLSINGDAKGVFIIEEGFTKYLLERHKRRNGPIFNTQDLKSAYYPNVAYESYSENSWTSGNKSLLNSGFSILNNLKDNQFFESQDYIDWKLWARFFAVIDLVEGYHGALSKSVRIYYNPITAKLEPIGFDAHKGAGSFENFILIDIINNKSNCLYICEEKPWFDKFFYKNNGEIRDEFLNEYLSYLKIISDEKYIKKFLNKYRKKIKNLNNAFYSDFSKTDDIFWKGLFPYIYDKNFLYDRASIIRSKILNYNSEKLKVSLKDHKLEFDTTTSKMPLKIKSNCSKDKKINKWIFGKGEIKWNNSCQEVKVINLNGTERNISLFKNPQLTKSELPLKKNNIETILNKDGVVEKNNNIFFDKEELILNKSYFIPKEKNFILKAGQSIILDKNSTIFSNGNLLFKGSIDNPSFIKGVGDSGQLIHFDGKVLIENLITENLNQPKNFYGYDLYSGLNFINSKVEINNLLVKNSKSEDSVNFINSEVNANNINILNAKSDGIDVDGGIFLFNIVNCNKIGNDCFDTSNAFSEGYHIVTKNVMDKSISVGENSEINITKINIDNSEIGIAVKDGSKMNVDELFINKTSLPLAVFKKKTEYINDAFLNIQNFNVKNSKEIYLVDNKSSLLLAGRKITGTKSGEEIEELLYGNVYGKATER